MSKAAFANILNAINKMSETGFTREDDNFWKAETDKAGNGFAVIRFLPGKTDEEVPFVKMYDHGFQGPAGKWFIEKCPTTIGHECPVCQANGPLWNSGRESDKEIVRKRKRRVSYIANVLVVSDPKNPDNEGKVFLFKFGKKIFDKIKDAISPPPEFPDEQPMNPFDAAEGSNFKLKIRKVEGYANFDKSEFEKPSEVENLETVLTQLNDLQKFIDPKSYKSFDELQSKFKQVVGAAPAAKAPKADPVEEEDYDVTNDIPQTSKKASPPPSGDEDDSLDYFRKLAED